MGVKEVKIMNLRWEILRRHPGSRKLYRHVAYDFICCVRNSVTNYHAIALNIAQCQLYLLAYLLAYSCTLMPKLKLHHFDFYELHGQRVVLQAVQMSRCRGFVVGGLCSFIHLLYNLLWVCCADVNWLYNTYTRK